MRAKHAALIAGTALITTLLPLAGTPAVGADAMGEPAPAQDYTAQIAASLNGLAPRQVSMRFFPSTIEVLAGDVIRFTAVGDHSAALLPLNQDPATWISTYYTGAEGAWSMYVADPDEGPSAIKLNNRAVVPPAECGTASTPCAFDGSGDGEDGVLSSGVRLGTPLDFYVQIDAPSGSTFWVVDLVDPELRMKVDVVSSNPSSQATIDAEKADLVAKDAAAATKLRKKYAAKKVAIKNKKGRTIGWKAWAGFDSGAVALRYMFPTKLTLKKGQFVQWAFSQDVHQGYTVTFPVAKAAELESVIPQKVCDLDGDEGVEPDASPDLASAPYCSDPRTLELDIPTEFVSVVGDGKWNAGKDFESSGLRGGPFSSSNKPFKLKFPKISSKKGFKYSSITHPWMAGKVVVKS